MDWIPALLKHLGLSRSFVAAAFATSLVLYLGPRLAPNYVDPVQREWVPVVVGVLVFSGFLLLVWGAAAIWGKMLRNYKTGSALIASYQISEDEAGLLHALGQNPREPLDLEAVDYAAVQLSQLEVLEMVHALNRKGLVSINPYSSKLISLTARGRERALEIQRNARRNGAI